MQNEATIIFGETGQMVLAVLGHVQGQNLELEVSDQGIVLKNKEKTYLEIDDMEQELLKALAALEEIAILEVDDPLNPPDEVKSWARIKNNFVKKV